MNVNVANFVNQTVSRTVSCSKMIIRLTTEGLIELFEASTIRLSRGYSCIRIFIIRRPQPGGSDKRYCAHHITHTHADSNTRNRWLSSEYYKTDRTSHRTSGTWFLVAKPIAKCSIVATVRLHTSSCRHSLTAAARQID